jgi:DNA-binding NarL/FixJ family response regulator
LEEKGRRELGTEWPPTAVILDQYWLWLETVKQLTERAGIAVVAATTSAEQAMETLTERQPNLFVLGLERESLQADVLEDLLQTASGIPEIRTLVVGDDSDPEFVDRCLSSGAYAYVLKTVHPEDLSAAIRLAMRRTIYLFTRPARDGAGVAQGATVPRLTSREVEVLRLVAEGLPNAQVARRLWISEPTVKYHLSRTYEKLGVSNRTGAARWAERHGLLDHAAS